MRLLILCFLVLAFFNLTAQVNLNTGLVAYFPFNGNSLDEGANGLNATVNGPTLTTDRNNLPNSAFLFNGTTDYIQLPYSNLYNFPSNGKFSISVWIQPALNNNWPAQALVVKSPFNSNYLASMWNYGTYMFNYKAMGGFANNNILNGTTTFTLNQCWYNIIQTYDNGKWNIYVNGVLESSDLSQTKFILQDGASSKIAFGRKGDASGDYYQGKMDDIRIYDRVLNSAEISNLSQQTGACLTNCSNWLSTPTQGSYLTVGDLDITGNQITVEANFNRSQPLNNGLYYGHLISKHSGTSDANYTLLPNGCEITTTNGYFSTFQTCPPQLNKTYHVAMVYNGSTLKFYRNGYLLSSQPCTGNMINNDWQTTINQYAAGTLFNNQFLGYLNEVRIWNVARTQTELQTYMNTSLPNPTTQVGLKGYYTFDNLLNKQGNAAFNATLNGASTINATNPNCSFVVDSCAIIPATPCTNWLSTPSYGSTATIGNLNVTGNQITVEGTFNCTAYSTPNFGGNIIAKHTNPSDVCYALSTHAAEISTSNNGYVYTLQTCTFELNKTYHVAMVYDGASLKFYRNGFLISQKPCSGNISSNSFNALIGNGPALPSVNQFIGTINEVRIWNVARTQSQLQTFMNTSLPNPTTQVGLLAYYTFDNLLNKQGNAAFNATLNGASTINATNPNCSFVADSCNVIVNNTPYTINDYTPILNLDPCKNILTVGNAAAFNVGDTVLMIQMKGAIIDSTNTAAFGTITDYKSAGNYEYNYVKSKTSNQIELKNKILRSYEIPNGKVQLIRVPYYQNYTTTGTLTCLPWDGTVGGVLVFNVANTLTLNNDINVSGKGFRKGTFQNSNLNATNCFTDGYYFPIGTLIAAGKGESITEISNSKGAGKGKLAAAGGGGLDHNSGGGGGANGGFGGFGGYQLKECGNFPFDNRGLGGNNLTYSNTQNKIFLGSGGGAGHSNNGFANPPNVTTNFDGGNGGGIVLISSNNIVNNGNSIYANGDSAFEINISAGYTHDGMGGGGSGGTIIIKSNSNNNITYNSKGGKGGDMHGSLAGGRIGPGGGGGGGIIWINQNTLPPAIITNLQGGNNGIILQDADSWGATPGQAGQTIFNLVLPIASVPFKPNIDSVKINATNINCSNFNFSGLGYTNTSPIATWNWYFGDGGTASGQNTSHNYTTTNTFTVKLVVTDINGCKDSITKNITTNSVIVDAGLDKTFCGAQNNIQLNGTSTTLGTNTYAWTSLPTTTINNGNSLNPTANVSTTTMFYLTVSSSLGCTGIDSVKVIINPIPIVQTLNDIAICKGTSLQLTSTLGLNTYHWSPGIYVSDSTISNPIFTDTVPRMLVLTGSNGLCSAKDTINISIKPLPIVRTIKDTLICNTQSINLTTTGAATYSWTPSTFLSSTTSASPTYLGTGSTTFTSTTYYVTGTASNGCVATDTLIVNMKIPNSFVTPPNKSFCKNESVQLDGANGNTVTYLWQPNLNLSNQNIINPIASPGATATYTVNINDPVCNFSQAFPVIVTVNPLPNVSISKSNDISCSVTKSNLTASGAQSYSWNSSSTLSSTNTPNTTATPNATTEYIVTGTDLFGCKDTGSIKVFVSSNINLFELPNTFTPNGDLKNDCFGILNFGNAQDVFFIIYNRWGEKVFETNNINTCWKGYHKGLPAVEGNYVYYISAKTACGNVVKKGNVLLIR